MNEPSAVGQVPVLRHFDEEHGLLVAHGQFDPIFQAYLVHAKRWHVEPDPLGGVMMRQALAAAALHLSCRSRDELTGWTLNFKEPPLNIFITGDARESSVTGRVFIEGVKTAERSRLFVQSQRWGAESLNTTIDFESLDVLDIFEEYYRRSEQHPARFFEADSGPDNGRFVIYLSLPEADLGWLAGLERDTAFAQLDRTHRELDTRFFRFACGCNVQKMREVVKLVHEEDPDWLFAEKKTAEIQCPRCGHAWILRREDLGES